MSKRILANVVVLGLFGLSFFVITTVLNMMAATDVADDQEFSFVKRTADRHWQNKDWKSSGRYFKELAQTDDGNSGAHLSYALSLKLQLEPLIRELNRQTAQTDDSAAIAEVESIVEETIAAFTEVLEFSHFRNFARLQLAFLFGYSGDKARSIEFLKSALNDGGRIKGLKGSFKFYRCSDVFDDPEIQTIIKRRFGKDILQDLSGNHRN